MRFLLITGFGLDKRAFAPLRLPEDRFALFDLIPALPDESLRDYALRMAKAMGAGPDDVVGGISFGGMLALEIAKALETRAVLLIASATHPRYIRKRFLLWSHLVPYAPDVLIRRVFALIPAVLSWQRMLSPPGQALLTDIMTRFPMDLLRSLPPKMRKWEGCPPAVPLRQIHSEGDWVIRLNGSPPDLTVVKGRNHLLTVSHPEAVRKFLMDAYEEFADKPVVAGR